MKTKGARLAGAGLVLAILAVAVAVPLGGEPDYMALPPKPSEMAAKLSGAQGRLVNAIKAAEGAVSGIAMSAEIRLDETPPVIEVIAYDDSAAWQVRVDFESGAVRGRSEIPRFPGEPVVGDWTESDSGLKYFDLAVGDGPSPAGPDSVVEVHYSGWLVTGEKFDSSVDRGTPATFPLNRVIPGWTEGVGGMNVGGKRKLIIPYQLAYGERGRPGAIPPKATLIFDVELLKIVNE